LFDVVDELRTQELGDAYVQRVKETLRSGFEEGLTSNQFWLGQIEYALKNDRPMSAIRRYLDLVDAVDSASIAAAARRYLPEDAYVQVTLYPGQSE
jgi:predicted Zn-dependent peptidase